MAVVNRRISLDFHLNEASAVIRHRFEWGVIMSCHSCANFSFLTMSQNAWKKGAALTVRLLNWRFTVSWQGHYRPAEADGRRRAAGVGEGPPARRPAEGAVCGCGARGGPCGSAARGRRSAGAGHDRGTAAQAGPLIRSRVRPASAYPTSGGVWPSRRCAGMWPGRAGPGRTARRRGGERYGTLEPLMSNRHRIGQLGPRARPLLADAWPQRPRACRHLAA
jgi:hypothetical protein